MQILIHHLTSPIHDASAVDTFTRNFIDSLQTAIHAKIPNAQISIQGDDFSRYNTADLSLIFVRTGGTEGLFRQLLQNNKNLQDTKHPVILLASDSNNSLAASMEILSYLNQHARTGEIIHGTSDYMAERICLLARTENALKQLQRKRIGVIGEPSDWLIASGINIDCLQAAAGISIQNISMKTLLQEIERKEYPYKVWERIRPLNSKEQHLHIEDALYIYGALCRLRKKYALDALTIRCFDLLDTVHNTGCLALALLNSEGTPASCEGDIPALLSMMISAAITGVSGFQANPSRIDPERGNILFAHCTVPLCMLTDYTYDTHFESGIGVALRGKLPEGPVTLFKTDGALERYMTTNAILLHNGQENNLCRTQITVQAPDTIDYFLQCPIGNHHIIIPGHHAELFESFMERIS
ncbi:MAG: hypothetical protein NC038_03840 [Paludibacter sp.]|nr:hypothetical protein [Bacteroidales bacterium]MCM1069210.1 hypothetical protein [Prevotella sp.]MCM1354115.1 hypothetical protein [Bacteroides sp.]MCM1442912.1 hypothetical protein [Muribaculum sp.]MCM1481765.1 hypothetical protein [Paludibacter sp.]